MKPEPASPPAPASAALPDGSGKGDEGHAGERLHSALLRNLTGAVYRCRNDADWTVEFISDGCLALTGYRAEELTGNRVISLGALMHPEDAARVWAKCQANLAAHRACSSEYRIRHRDGGERWVWDQAQGVYAATGELLFIEGLLTDITAQKAAETQALTFAALGRQLNAATSARAAAEIILAAAQRLFGWDAATVDLYSAATGTVEFIVNRDTLDGRRLDVAPSMPSGPPSPRGRKVLREGAQLILREPPFAFGDGDVPIGDTRRPSASIMTVPVREGAGVVGLLSIQSYTPHAYSRADLETLQALADYCGGAFHRLQTREALRASEERLRLAVHAANVGLWDWDVGTNQVTYSREWKSQLGYAEEEISPAFSEWESRVHPDDLAPTLERVRRALASAEEVYEVEFRMRHKDGSWRWIYTRAEVFRDAQGRAARVIGCHVDVTGRKQTERQQAAFAALGRRLNEATDEAGAARIIVDIADDLFSWDSCKLDLYDAQSDRCRSILTMDVVNGQRQEVPPAYVDTPPSSRLRRSLEGVAELILREPPLALTPDRMPFGDVSRPSASLLSVPLREGGHVVGVLAIQSYRLHAYTNADLAALQDLADHCAGALERVRSRAEVERQRNELELILHTVPGIIFYKDRAHRLVRVNEAHARSMGLPRSAIEGRTDAELGSPFAEHYLRDDEEVMRTGQPKLGIIEPLQTPAGTRWLQTDKLPYRDAQGNIIGVLGFALDITERRQAEADLRASEERLRLATQAAGIGAFEWDVQAGVNIWTPKLEALHGLRPGEFPGTQPAWEQLVHPADRARAVALVQHAFDTLSPQAGEWRVIWPDGSVHWLAGRFQAFNDEAGVPRRLIGANFDITARKQAEAAQRVAESKYHAIFQQAIEGIYQSTAEGHYLTLNPAMARIYGYASAAEMLEEVTDIGQQLYLDPEDRQRMQALLHAQGGAGVFECQMRRKDGALIWIRQSARVVRDGRGRVLCYEGSVEDITERRLAEERLRHQHALLTAVVEGATDAVFLKDLAGRYQLINAAGARAIGLPVEEILGHTDAELLPPETASRFRAVDEAVVATGTTQVQEESGIMAGRMSHWHANKAPWRDADGRIQGVIGVSRDITERRLAEAARREAEQAMRESEAALNRAQAVAHLGSWRLDMAQNRLTWSAESHRIFGVPEGTPMNYEFFLARVHPEDRPQVDGAWQAALEGAPYDLEHRILVADQVKWVREQAVLEFDAAGRLLGGLGTVQDITGRKRAEQRLAALASLGRELNAAREVREAARLIVGVADELFGWDACFVELYDPQGQPVPVLTMDTVEGRKLEVSIMPRERPTPGPASRLIETGELILRDPAEAEAEARFVPFGDTGRRSASLLFVPLRLHGRSTGLLSIQSYRPLAYNRETLATLQALADYTALSLERLLAQEALRESESRYRTLFAHSPQPMWVFDPVTLGFLEVNEAAVQLYGFTREEFLAMKTTDLRPPEERERHLQSLMLDAPGVRDLGVWRHWKKDRTALWVQVFAHAVEFAGGRAELVLVHDVTAQLAAEAEVVQLSGRLLRAQDEERRRLAREIHDSTAQTFAALAMNLAVLARSTPGMDDASRALLAECETQVRRGTAELRTLAYLLHPPALDALGLTRAIHDYAEGFARRSGVRVELDVAELPVRLPPETELTLFRVLQESLGNIHRHSGSATAAIRLAQDAETVVIEVRDTGCGLGAAEQAAATSGSARFGVGIAGMRERLRLLGGRLEVEPALPGVRVRATLPLSTTAADE